MKAIGLGLRFANAVSHLFRRRDRQGAAVAVVHGDQILVVRHSYRPGQSLPGGAVGRGETPESAAARELAEEVGIEAPPGTLRSVYATLRLRIFEYRPQERPRPVVDRVELLEADYVEPGRIEEPDRVLRQYLRCRIP